MTSYIPIELRRLVRQDAGRRCGYCLSSEALLGTAPEFDHLIPESAGGLTIRENLWLACHNCNKQKGSQLHAQDVVTQSVVRLFHPREEQWFDHFRWSRDGAKVEGITAIGRATILALKMNNEFIVESRQFWVSVGWHPPQD